MPTIFARSKNRGLSSALSDTELVPKAEDNSDSKSFTIFARSKSSKSRRPRSSAYSADASLARSEDDNASAAAASKQSFTIFARSSRRRRRRHSLGGPTQATDDMAASAPLFAPPPPRARSTKNRGGLRSVGDGPRLSSVAAASNTTGNHTLDDLSSPSTIHVDPASVATVVREAKEEVDSLLAELTLYESRTERSFDLVASHACCSLQVRKLLGSAFVNPCWSQGGAGGLRQDELECVQTQTRRVVGEVFGAKFCELLSGGRTVAHTVAYRALLPPHGEGGGVGGRTVMAACGGPNKDLQLAEIGFLTRLYGANKVVQTPWDRQTYTVIVPLLGIAMATHKPALLILGGGETTPQLFENDLPAIRRICDEFNCKLLYDMSHVAGLIAGQHFQPDVMDCADMVVSTSGKSLHAGDQGGLMVLYNDPALTQKVRDAVQQPLLMSSSSPTTTLRTDHYHEMAALCMALLELKAFGGAYAQQVVANTQALARELVKRKFAVLCPELGYSKSHELILDLRGASGVEAAQQLAKVNIFVTPLALPNDELPDNNSVGPTGLRIGTQVLTRRGFKEGDMMAVAKAMSDILLQQKEVAPTRKYIQNKCSTFPATLSFTFPSEINLAIPGYIAMVRDHDFDDGYSC